MARKIDTDANINSIRLVTQGSNPSTPAAGFVQEFVKTDGLPYAINSTGTVVSMYGRQLIATSSPNGTGTVSFTSIPAIYTHLEIEYVARSTKGAVVLENMKMGFNGDTTAANYRYTESNTSGAGTNGGAGGDDFIIDILPAANSPANSPSRGIVSIPFYKETAFYKDAIGLSSSRLDLGATQLVFYRHVIEWENTVAISRIDFTLASGNFVAGSQFRLYGIF